MARCRTEFVFGKLIDRGDEIEKSENIKSIQKQLENFGLKTPFIEEEDLSIALAIIDYIKLWKGEKERPLKTTYRPPKVEPKEEYFPFKTEKKPDVKCLRRAKSLNDISNIVEVDQDLKKEERKVIEIIETIEESELLDVSEKDFEDERLLEISNKTGKTDETDRTIETDEHSEINTSKESESLEEGEIESDDEVEKYAEKLIENSEENQGTKKIEENRVEKSADSVGVNSESELPVESEPDIDKEIKTESTLKAKVKNDNIEIPKRSLSLSDIFSLARDWNFYEKYKPIKKEQVKKQERVEMKKPFEDSPPIDLVSKPENETVSDNIGTPEVPTCAVRPLARGFSQSPKSSGNSPQSSKEMEIPFQGRIPNFQGPGVPGKFYSGLHPRPNNQGLSPQSSTGVPRSPGRGPGSAIQDLARFSESIRPFQMSSPNIGFEAGAGHVVKSSRIRLTIQALEALIQEPNRFHRIDFNDGKGHFFKKAAPQDKVRFPNGEFFTARVRSQEHYFVSLVVEKGADCGLETPCCRRDCPVHVRLQFQIEHCHTAARRPFKTNRFDYRITRILHDINQKLYMPKELTITSFDVENFNTFVIKHLSLKSEDECYRTIQGRPVPLIIIHALISLRAPANDIAIPVEDWREVIIELEVLPRWPIPTSSSDVTNYVEHNLDGVIMKYSRYQYIKQMQSAVNLVEAFYERFRPLLRNITVNSNLIQPPPPSAPHHQIGTVIPPIKRPRFV